jgi:hypothetical protein
MDGPEIILNLWYVFDERGEVYSLRARAYVQSGSDEEKLAFLQRFAETDYLIARPFPVPERCHTTVVAGGITKKMPFLLVQALATQGGPVLAADLFEEAMRQIQEDLPATTKLSIPEDPLICLTGLFADDDGNLQPRSDGRAEG